MDKKLKRGDAFDIPAFSVVARVSSKAGAFGFEVLLRFLLEVLTIDGAVAFAGTLAIEAAHPAGTA